jgi:hypothetical protein
MANCAHTSFDPDDELIRESEFKALFGGVCGFTIYRWRKADPDFPKPDYVRTSRSGKQQLRYYSKRKALAYRSRKLGAVAA